MNVSNEHPQFKFNGKIMKMYPKVIKYSLTTPLHQEFFLLFLFDSGLHKSYLSDRLFFETNIC